MKDYLLFIDTEASSLPKNWNLPYSVKGNWPFCLQVSWIIYTKDGEEIKVEDHYINDSEIKIASSATKIHGLTKEFLAASGKSRNEVMHLLAGDIAKYQPMIVGHFMDFDYHMVAADFYRASLENPIGKDSTFCTMLATTHLVKNPRLKFFRLGELYQVLFNTGLENQHNALVDARATAQCFFELVNRGEITEEMIVLQQQEAKKKTERTDHPGCFLPLFLVFIITLLIYYYL